jgi:hypothetical protein
MHPLFVIFNANGHRWGSETYESREVAARELRSFWKGVSGVRLDLFTIADVPADQAATSLRLDIEGWRSSRDLPAVSGTGV